MVDLPIKIGDFPWLRKRLPGRVDDDEILWECEQSISSHRPKKRADEYDESTKLTIYTTFRSISGWCFGTWMDYFSIYWECHNPNWTPSFFRGVAKNHQPDLVTRLVMIIQLEHYMAEGRAHVRAVATQTRNGRNGQNQVSKNGQTWM